MTQQAERLYEFGPYRLNPAQQLLLVGTKKIPLTPKAFKTLCMLVEAQGRVVSKDELLQKVWPDTFVEEATLAQNIFTLRKLLQDGGERAVYIETVSKRGYRFAAAIRIQEAPEATNPGSVSGVTAQARARVLPRWIVPVMASVLIAIALVFWFGHSRSSRTPSTSPRIMLAVLPVKNLTGNGGQEYLADGLTEEVIADLGSLNPLQLGVIARTSSMAYKETNKTIRDIGRELQADYVLESSLREGSGNVRFTAQLIRTQDQTHVWARNYDRSVSDVLALQSELARAVAEEIRIALPSEVAARLSSPTVVSPEAYDNYLKGRFFWNKRTPEALITAEHYFHEAVQTEPQFAQGYAGLADCYQVMVNIEQLTASDGFARAKAAAQKSLDLDSTLADAHTSLASIKGDFDWDWRGADTEYKKAIQLNPNYATAHHWYAEFLAGMGSFDAATVEINKALELDPLSPVIGISRGQMYCRVGRCELAIQEIKKTLVIYPDFAEGHEALADIYAHLGMYQDARGELDKEGLAPAVHPLPLLAYASAKAGRREESLRLLHDLQNHGDPRHLDYYAAMIYAALGDKDQAFSKLEKARLNHEPFMAYFRADYKLETLRSDLRFAQLAKRMNMPNYNSWW